MKRFAMLAVALFGAASLAGASGAEEDGPTDYSGIDIIVVRSGPLDVIVGSAGGAEVSLETPQTADFFHDDGSGSRVVRQRDGSRLTVGLENGGLFRAPASGEIRLRAPRDASLLVETGSGRVLVDGLESTRCRVRTVSGRVQLDHVRGRFSASSVSGSIDLDSTEGSVEARTVSGSITGRNVRLTDDSEFSSISGGIDIELDSALEDFSFALRSLSGSITVGALRAMRGLRMGFGRTLVRGSTVSGSMAFR